MSYISSYVFALSACFQYTFDQVNWEESLGDTRLLTGHKVGVRMCLCHGRLQIRFEA